ncbi:MAG: 50S ribosomal protein L15e [Candidatus Woesearchaeota archaeon]
MGYIKYVRATWRKQEEEISGLMRQRRIDWKNEPATLRIEHPTRIDRARALGFKAKQGFLVVRQRVSRGGRQRPDIKGGRKTSNSGQRKYVSKNYQQIAEEKASKKFVNCEVLNSYYVTQNGQYAWYEVLLVERDNPQVYLNQNTAWAHDTKNRALRGLTSAARRARGLNKKGFGSEKTRPSKRANSK